MRNLIFTIIMLLTFSVASANTDTQLIEQLIENVNDLTVSMATTDREVADECIRISDNGKYSDLMMLELYFAVTLPDETVQNYIETQNADGTWSDVDYEGTNRSRWQPALHYTRIHALTKVYKNDASKYYNDTVLSATIHKAIHYWHSAKLISPNWWYNDIRAPKHLGPVYLLLRDELSAQELHDAQELMQYSEIEKTGQNKVWLAGNVLMRGLLSNDLALVKEARNAIASEIFYSTKEGLQPDNTFHQHGPQMQMANYGMAYLSSMCYWARVLGGTELAFSDEQIALLRNFLLEGMNWNVWRGIMGPNSSGRQVLVDTQKGKGYAMIHSAQNLAIADWENKEKYDAIINNEQLALGSRYFWRSDFLVHYQADWHATLRMHSARILGYEMTNNENLQGVFSSDGVLLPMITGHEYENIYPIWNWRRLPGATISFDSNASLPYSYPKKPNNHAHFVGAATNGISSVATMHLNKDGVRAKKSYFFFEDYIVALGTDITSETNHKTYTTLSQELANGEMSVGLSNGKSINTDKVILCTDSIRWIHHGNVGYYMLEKSKVEFGIEQREGSWHSVAAFYPEDKIHRGQVFMASVVHDENVKDGTYAYLIMPNVKPRQLKRMSNKLPITLVENSKARQVVCQNSTGTIGAVMHEPGQLRLDATNVLRVKSPCVLIVSDRMLYIADPTQQLSTIEIEYNGCAHTIKLIDEDGLRGQTTSAIELDALLVR